MKSATRNELIYKDKMESTETPSESPGARNRTVVRESGIELLRLVSMFLILSLHVNFYVFGQPSVTDFKVDPANGFLRSFLESIAIVGVDVFVLISGWFGIRPKARRFASLLFQTTFFCCLAYEAGLLFGVWYSSWDVLGNLVFLGPQNWFLRSYLLLYAASPVLEAFVSTASEKTFRFVLAGFFGFQTVYGWLLPGADYFEVFRNGYSPLSFVGLYLLARYVRVFRPRFACRSRCTDLFSYFLLSAITAMASAFQTLCQRRGIDFFAYNSPLVVAAALFLFLFFAKWNFASRIVNSVAQSSLAVYLLHMHPSVCGTLFIPVAVRILRMPNSSPLLILPFLLSVFAAAVLLDRVRIVLWMFFVKAIDRSRASPGQVT